MKVFFSSLLNDATARGSVTESSKGYVNGMRRMFVSEPWGIRVVTPCVCSVCSKYYIYIYIYLFIYLYTHTARTHTCTHRERERESLGVSVLSLHICVECVLII